MRNPGESSEPRAEGETRSEAIPKDSQRDDCDSPPCKRLKQAVLPFSVLPPSSLTSPVSSKTPVSSTNNVINSNNSESKPSESCEKTPQPSGGLVTAAPSPPDTKENSVKPQTTIDPSKVSKSLALEDKENTASGSKDTNSISSPESSNSSHNEEELMIIESPPAKAQNPDRIMEKRKTPLLKSAEKLKRKEEREKERLERQRLKEEKLKEKQEAKALKEKERLEAKRKRDQEKQEKQAERERKEKERVEKKEKEEKERLEKKEKRDEEKRKREEGKNAKIEEKRKREAEKRSIEEEQERKRQKVQENFVSFFTKSSASTPKITPIETSIRFKPFEVKTGMSLAPVIRRHLPLDRKQLLDEGLQLQDGTNPYLRELEDRKPISMYTKRRLSTIEEQPKCDADEKMPDGAIVVEDENSNCSIEIIEKKKDVPLSAGLKNKLLQFHKDYRPAYYGTMRKKSLHISPRNPFKKDMDLLDYEVDSDDEWEEEEPGESLSNSEGEDEGEGDDDNEDEDGFFVPHGYLSDDEGVEDGDECDENDENKGQNPENTKDQQLAKAKAWEAEMKRKCKPLKPVTLGCLWLDDATLNLTLKQFAACLLTDGPISVETSSSATTSRVNEGTTVDTPSSSNTSGALYVPDEAMPDLIKLLHNNTAGLNKLINQFRKQWTAKCLGRDVTDEEVDEKSPISKRQLEKRIQNIATKERRSDRLRWYVHSHVLSAFGLENLLVVDGLGSTDTSTETAKFPTAPHMSMPSIIQFTRPVSPAPNRGASPELKNHTQNLKPVGDSQNTTSPMEVDNGGASLCVNHHGPADGSSCTNGPNSHLLKESESQSKTTSQWQVCEKQVLITSMTTGSKTESNTDHKLSGVGIETVCID